SDAQDIEELAAKLASARQNPTALQLARTAAEAEVALLRIRRLRSVLIQEITRLASAPGEAFDSSVEETRLVKRWMRRTKSRVSSTKPIITSSEQNGAAELAVTINPANIQAVRRILARLKLLSRYEQREWCRRERAFQLMRTNCKLQLTSI